MNYYHDLASECDCFAATACTDNLRYLVNECPGYEGQAGREASTEVRMRTAKVVGQPVVLT